MGISVAKQSYGKSQVCLSYIDRDNEQFNFTQLVANISLAGDFNAAYTDGDNSKVVPTDTMKNSVYAIARKHGVANIESFASNLAGHFFNSFDHVAKATAKVEERLWQRIEIGGKAHPHSFVGGGSEKNTCRVVCTEGKKEMSSGLLGLQVLKTTESGFEGFLKDQFTTLTPTSDRIFATTITADWPCSELDRDWTATRTKVREKFLEVFATTFSPSVQKTLRDMADAAFEACPEIDEISLNMPNQHHILADMAKLKLENNNDMFVPTPEPFGIISATVRRDG